MGAQGTVSADCGILLFMRFILTPMGSEGDLYPFVTLALLLKQRGHDVLLVHNEYFTPMLKNVDVPKKILGSAAEYMRMASNPDVWHPTRSLKVLGRELGASLDNYFQGLLAEVKRGPCVLLVSSLSPAGRIVQDLTNTKTITIHLQPAVLASVFQTPLMSLGSWFGKSPRLLKHFLYRLGDFVFDRAIGPHVNRLRKKVGLKKVRRILLRWMNSPDGVLCLFPPWYAPRQPDWPRPLAMATFPAFDQGSQRGDSSQGGQGDQKGQNHSWTMTEDDRKFFETHRPIVITHGTANFTAQRFFEACVLTLARNGLPAVLLSRHREQIPKYLPDNMRWYSYLPFSQVLPYCNGIVHHGGVGTMSQALRVGCPQLVVPMAHDQFDNGDRVARMGAGSWSPLGKFDTRVIETWLGRLASGDFREGASLAASQMGRENFNEACFRAFAELGIKI